MKITKSKKEKKVPLLGDIPLLGYLFTHTEDVDEKHNLIIMLSPTILDERKPVTGMEAIAQLTVNKFEQTPLALIKNEPTNQVFTQSLSTNIFRPHVFRSGGAIHGQWAKTRRPVLPRIKRPPPNRLIRCVAGHVRYPE